MVALIRLSATLALVMAVPAHADPVDRWRPIVAEASIRCGIPTSWIERVIRAESAGLTAIAGRPIRSRAGAIGLMQLMPATWDALRARLGLGRDPDDPRDNILAGTCYLRWLYDRFGYPGLFAAYNAGPARYAAFLAGRQPLPGETIAYLSSVGGGAPMPGLGASNPPPPPTLFAVRHDRSTNPNSQQTTFASASLFAIRTAQP
ncbi:lytic transglycosylase domain-containing protein [Sphingomonas koreensis]|nr:lytic transglycosylase domain-containing protein [Sphingomonas koreensis]